jgi:hypothetical protein
VCPVAPPLRKRLQKHEAREHRRRGLSNDVYDMICTGLYVRSTMESSWSGKTATQEVRESRADMITRSWVPLLAMVLRPAGTNAPPAKLVAFRWDQHSTAQ